MPSLRTSLQTSVDASETLIPIEEAATTEPSARDTSIIEDHRDEEFDIPKLNYNSEPEEYEDY